MLEDEVIKPLYDANKDGHMHHETQREKGKREGNDGDTTCWSTMSTARFPLSKTQPKMQLTRVKSHQENKPGLHHHFLRSHARVWGVEFMPN